MSDVQQWVNLNSSWADSAESEIQQETVSNTPKSAWGQVTNVEVFDIAKAQEEEKKKKKTVPVQKKSDEPYQRREHQGERTYEGQRYNNERRERDNNYEKPVREKREKQPVPDSPPFVAFVGNLPFDATENDLHEFFGDLGVVSVRLLFDHDSGRSKGISYVEFKTRDGLVNALKSDGYDFKGRNLRVDVENRRRETREGSRPNKGGFSDFSRPRQFDRPEPAKERPKLNINPPPQRAQPAPAPAPEAPKAREEDPFGGKVDVDKLAEQARKQEERQREIEKRKQEEEKKRIEQRNAAKHSSPSSSSSSSTTVEGSWRKPPGGDASKPTGFYGKSNNNNNNRGGKTDNRPVGGGRPQGQGRNYESQGSGARTGGGVGRGSDPNRKEQNEAKQSSKSQAPTNRFAALGLNDSNGGDEENDE
eukprot:TRINITY_DN108_c1_g1_i1.p2 TRINITY_DN108_c1_g1~~TRINITY_DN108_c1_g1_i1.p2  ORF type:complete len:420 (-),score=163.98 TRINITY_DN108_c1_g1_i1:250-1509(-)